MRKATFVGPFAAALAASPVSAQFVPPSLTINSTPIIGGTTGRLLYDNAGGAGELILGTNLSITGSTLNAVGGVSTTLASAHILVGNASNVATDVAMSGDCTVTNTGAISCTKTGGVSFGSFATGTDAANLTGTIAAARLTGASYSFTAPALGAATGTSLALGAGSPVTSTGAGGSLGTNAFNSTAYAPLASPTFTGTVTLPNNVPIGIGTALTSSGAGGTALATGGATLSAAPSNPTGTTSATAVMMGLGGSCTLTPVASSRVHVTIQGDVANSGVSNTATFQAKFGTGTAPVNGAANAGSGIASTSLQLTEAVGGNVFPFSFSGVITGRTPGTALWFDMNLAATAGTSTLTNLTCSAFEI